MKRQYTKILDAYGCLGVLQLNGGENNILYLVMITGCYSVGKIGDTEIFRITQTQFVPLHYQHNEDRISEVISIVLIIRLFYKLCYIQINLAYKNS